MEMQAARRCGQARQVTESKLFDRCQRKCG